MRIALSTGGGDGGVAERLANEIEERTKQETRSLILGHLQCGGQPTGQSPYRSHSPGRRTENTQAD